MDVPDIVSVEESEVIPADKMEDPGEYMFTHDPKFEKEERPSELVVDPMVNALGADAGDLVQASVLSFPAATIGRIPALNKVLIALFKDAE